MPQAALVPPFLFVPGNPFPMPLQPSVVPPPLFFVPAALEQQTFGSTRLQVVGLAIPFPAYFCSLGFGRFQQEGAGFPSRRLLP